MDKKTASTLGYYNEKATDFTKDTHNVEFSEFQDEFTKYLKPNAHILDLGCGSGRDSRAFIEKGYRVTAVDGSQKLAEIASAYIGQEVICATFQDYEPEENVDGIWACASLLHLSYSEITEVIRKLAQKLNAGGCFYVSFKYGTFSGERNGRFFTDLTEQSFKELIENNLELEIINQRISDDVRLGRSKEKWLNVIMRRITESRLSHDRLNNTPL